MKIKAFLSSTFQDLEKHRSVLIDTLLKMGDDVVLLAMEHFGSDTSNPIQLSISKVSEANLYIGVFGWRYGTVDRQSQMSKSQMSITEIEYRTALAKGVPILLYLASEQQQVPPGSVETGRGATKIRRLRKEIAESHTVQYFSTPEDLARRVAADLYRIVAREVSEVPIQHLSDDRSIGPEEVNPGHPYVLSHMAKPSAMPNNWDVDLYLDVYYDDGTREYKQAMDSVDRVIYQLHHSFNVPVIPMQNREENFRVKLYVVGEFWARAVVRFKEAGRPPVALLRYVNVSLPRTLSKISEEHDEESP